MDGGDAIIYDGDFKHRKHLAFLQRFLKIVPFHMVALDTNQLTVAYFVVVGIDILGKLDDAFTAEEKDRIINWVYDLQILPVPVPSGNTGNNDIRGGFRGSHCLGYPLPSTDHPPGGGPVTQQYDWSHIASTYSAIMILLTLGDDLSRVNRSAISRGIAALQLDNGCIQPMGDGAESGDMRFVFCACAVSYSLGEWSLNKDALTDFILSSLTYEGAFSQSGTCESHAGSTFCAVASLALLDRLSCLRERQRDRLQRWLLARQLSGFQGRPNKLVDTCYSFWVGASLGLLESLQLSDPVANRCFILSTQDPTVGGFGKEFDAVPDPLHTFYGLSGLSLIGEMGLQTIFPALCISHRAHSHLERLKRSNTS